MFNELNLKYMKKYSIYLSYLLLIGVLWSCGPTQSQEMKSESSNKANSIKISGKRGTPFDPFQTSIIINGFDQSDTLIAEIYSKDFTNESVLFLWPNDNTCKLTFIQQDDSKRILNVNFKEDGNSLKEEVQ